MLEEAHQNLEELLRAFAGQGAPGEVERTAAHLTGCRECWLLANRAIAAQRASGALASRGPAKPLIDLHEMEQARLVSLLEAQSIWTEVRSLSFKARRDKVRLTRALHNLSFLEVLLEEGTAAAPAEGEEYFYLALLAASQLPSPKFSVELKSDLCAECCAEIANTRRRLAKWPAARDALKKGNDYADRGSKSGVVLGRLLCVAGALEDDLGNTEEAATLLRRAAGLFEKASQIFLTGRTLAQLSYVLADPDPAESLRVVEQALALLSSTNPRLIVFLETIRMNCLVTLGSPQEALLRFNDLKPLYQQFREPYIQIRRRYTAARILEHLGHSQRAETLFQEVIANDLEHGLVKDFFLDLVYLLGFHLRRDQTADAIALCRRASQELSLMEDEEGSGEPARAQMQIVWRGLEEEVRRGTVSLGAPAVLRGYIKAHWRFPASEIPALGQPAGDRI